MDFDDLTEEQQESAEALMDTIIDTIEGQDDEAKEAIVQHLIEELQGYLKGDDDTEGDEN